MKRFCNSFFMPVFIVLVGIVFSLFISWKSSDWIDKIEQERFDAATEQTIVLIQNKLKENVQLLHSLVAFISSSEDVTRKEWNFFIKQHDLSISFMGQKALAYAPRISVNEQKYHEQTVQKEGFLTYKIHPKVTVLKDAYPIVYIEPFNKTNEKILGFDLSSEQIRKHAIDEAILTGKIVISSKIELIQELALEEKIGFIIVNPVYDQNASIQTPKERMESVKGIVSFGISAKKLFENILTTRYIALDFEIYNGNAPLETQKLYDSNPSIKTARLERYVSMDFYGQKWTLYFKADHALDIGVNRYIPLIEFILGSIFAIILGSWIYALQRTRKKAYAIVDEKTSKLTKSEAEIRTIFHTMQEGIFILDKEGIIIECNVAAQDMVQLPHHKIIGKASSESHRHAIHEDGTPFSLEEYPSVKVLKSGQAEYNVIMGFFRPDTTLLWVQINVEPIFFEGADEITSILLTFSDITTFRKSKYELERYVSIIDKYVIISSTDLYGVITEVSEAFCYISGYSKDELIGQNHNLVRHPDMPHSLYKEMWKSLKNGKPWSGEIKNKHKNGSDYWTDIIITPRYDDTSHMVGYTAIRNDITDKKRVEELSITDPLTGLHNRLKLDERFSFYLSMTRRHQKAFSIVMLDIDKFKFVNDTYGHQVGDSVLQELAKILQASVRFEDAVGRWGGEEFLIMLPETTKEAAILLAEKLRTNIEQTSFLHVNKQTASFGVATFHSYDDEKSMVTRADKALYLAKKNGRNRVEAEESSIEIAPF